VVTTVACSAVTISFQFQSVILLLLNVSDSINIEFIQSKHKSGLKL